MRVGLGKAAGSGELLTEVAQLGVDWELGFLERGSERVTNPALCHRGLWVLKGLEALDLAGDCGKEGLASLAYLPRRSVGPSPHSLQGLPEPEEAG